jgi:hypothetical protein
VHRDRGPGRLIVPPLRTVDLDQLLPRALLEAARLQEPALTELRIPLRLVGKARVGEALENKRGDASPASQWIIGLAEVVVERCRARAEQIDASDDADIAEEQRATDRRIPRPQSVAAPLLSVAPRKSSWPPIFALGSLTAPVALNPPRSNTLPLISTPSAESASPLLPSVAPISPILQSDAHVRR